MKLKKLHKRLLSVGIPVAYGVFKEETEPPFIVYEISGESDFEADNIHYLDIDEGFVELYTPRKNMRLEKKLEAVFEKNGIFYERTASTYIETEDMQCTRWEITLI